MNLLAVVIGCLASTTFAFILGLHNYQSIMIASIVGIVAGHTSAWTINRLAKRELRSVRFAYLTEGPPWMPHMIDRIEQDGRSYYRIHILDRDGSLVQNLLPAELVSLRAGNSTTPPVVCERRLCIKNKFLSMLALCKMELVDYQVNAPYDKLP